MIAAEDLGQGNKMIKKFIESSMYDTLLTQELTSKSLSARSSVSIPALNMSKYKEDMLRTQNMMVGFHC